MTDKEEAERARQRILEEAKRIRIKKAEGDYLNDNPHLEYKSKWGKKLDNLEEKYKDMPKIAFHKLDDEGQRKFMQIQRDKVWTTLTWSLIGNVVGVGVVRYIEKNSDKYKNLRQLQKREMMKVGGFLGTVLMFTLYGYGCAK